MSSEIFESIKKQAANVSPFNAKLKFILDDRGLNYFTVCN